MTVAITMALKEDRLLEGVVALVQFSFSLSRLFFSNSTFYIFVLVQTNHSVLLFSHLN